MPVFFGKFAPKDGHAGNSLTKDKIREILKRADVNEDGNVDKKELKKAFGEIGSLWAGRRADRCIKSCDSGLNGLISGTGEFEKVVENVYNKYGDK